MIEFPHTVLGWLGYGIAAIFFFIAFYSRIRTGELDALKQSNEALRNFGNDLQKELDFLKREVRDLKVKHEGNVKMIVELSTKNHLLERIIQQSLTDYFKDNPSEAKKVCDESKTKGT